MDFGLLWPREPLFYSIVADGMMNDVSINLPPPPSVPISMTNNETVDNNDEGNIEGLETSIGYQFVSVVGGLFQSIDSSMVDDDLSPTDDVILSNPSSDLSSCAGNEIFDPSNTLPLFRCSSLSTISKEFSVISDNASLDSFYGFAPLSSAFQSAF